MICKNCKKFFSVQGETVGDEAVCPGCGSPQQVERKSVECTCVGCKQKLQFEMWMEGESAQCPSCGKTVMLRSIVVPKLVVPTPRFRTIMPSSPPVPPPSASAPETGTARPRTATAAHTPSVASPATSPKTSTRTSPPTASGTKVPSTASVSPKTMTIPVFTPQESVLNKIRETHASTLRPSGKAVAGEASALAGKVLSVYGIGGWMPVICNFFGSVYGKIAIVLAVLLIIGGALFTGRESVSTVINVKNAQIVKYVADNLIEELKNTLYSIPWERRIDFVKPAVKESLESRNTEVLEMLLKDKFADPGEKLYEGKSLFDLAVTPDYRWLVPVFIHCASDLNTRLSDNSTLLEHAVNNKDNAFTQQLLKHGASANTMDSKGVPVVFHTVGNAKVFMMFASHGLDVNIRDNRLNTLLHIAVKGKKYRLAEYLIGKGADPGAANNICDTPLIILMRHNAPRSHFFNVLLKSKCSINTVNLRRESALSLAITNKRYELIIPLLRAGLSRDNEQLANLPEDCRIKDRIKAEMERLSSGNNAVEEQPVLKNRAVTEFVSAYSKNAVHISWKSLLLWLGWIVSGLFSLRLLGRDEDPPFKGIFNLLALFCGPVTAVVYLCIQAWQNVRRFIRSRLDRRFKARMDTIRFFNFSNEECSHPSLPENAALLNMCRDIFMQAIASRSSAVIFNPSHKEYHIALRKDENDTEIKVINTDVARKILVLLKNMAGMNPFEEVAPQSGAFTIQNKEQRNRVVVNTVGLGTNGERAMLSVKDSEVNISSFRQLSMSRPGIQALTVLFKAQRGLMIVTGADREPCMKLTALLLEDCAAEIGESVWVGDGNEPMGPDEVPRLKADPVANVTAEQLLAALPDCRAAGITVSVRDTEAMRYAVNAAGRKFIILVMDAPNGAEAVNRLKAAGVTNEALANVLRLTVTPLQLHKLCHCALPGALPEVNRHDFLANSLSIKKLRQKNGCPECAQTGEERAMVMYSAAVPSPQWLKNPSADDPVARLACCMLASRGLVDINEVNSCFAKFGGFANV